MSSVRVRPGHVQISPKKILTMVGVAAAVMAGILVFTLITSPVRTDYITYWCAGKLLVHHGNPYSPAAVFALEKAHGFISDGPMIMLNPPWALFLAAPLGILSARAGLFLWTLLAAGCVFAFVTVLRVPNSARGIAFVFAPALACIFGGQSAQFLLLGFVLFLRFHRSRPFLAGASLLLMAIKPHLFLVFWTLLLIDCVYRRRFRILAGGATALAAAGAFSMYFDWHIWRDYLAMVRGYRLQQAFLPTISMLFRMLINVRDFWLLFVPSAFAIVWGIWYYARNRQAWDWRIHGMLLMVVTVLVSPYGFVSDQVVLLPSLVFALTFKEARKYSAWALLAINSVILYLILVHRAALSSADYIWTPVMWLVWFLYATGAFQRRDRTPAAGLVNAPEAAGA